MGTAGQVPAERSAPYHGATADDPPSLARTHGEKSGDETARPDRSAGQLDRARRAASGGAGLRSRQRRADPAGRVLRPGDRRRPRLRPQPRRRRQRRRLRVDPHRRPPARPADAAGLPHGPARHRWRRQDGSEGALRHQRRHRPGAAQRLPLLRDAALGRAFQAHSWPARAHGCGRSGRRRLPGAARSSGQGHRLRRQGQPVRDRRPAVERVCRPRSSAGRQGPGSVPAARTGRRRVEVQRRHARARPTRRRTATPPACGRAWRSPGTTAISTWR